MMKVSIIRRKITKKNIQLFTVLITMLLSIPIPILLSIVLNSYNNIINESPLVEFDKSNKMYEDGIIITDELPDRAQYEEQALQEFLEVRDKKIQENLENFYKITQNEVKDHPEQEWIDYILSQDEIQAPIGQIDELDEPIVEVLGRTRASIITKTIYSSDLIIVRTKTVSGFTTISPLHEDNSYINGISVPIVPKERISTDNIEEESGLVLMGYKESKPIIDHTWHIYFINKNLNAVHYTIKMKYNFNYQFELPVTISIKHPRAVTGGQDYELSVNVKPAVGEMSIELELDSKIEGEEYVWWIEWEEKWKKILWWWVKYWVPHFKGEWREYAVPDWVYWIRPPVLSIGGSITTPLADTPGIVRWITREIDALKLYNTGVEFNFESGSFMDNYFPLRGFGFMDTVGILFGDKLTASLSASGSSTYTALVNETTFETTTKTGPWRSGWTYYWGEDHCGSDTEWFNCVETVLRAANRQYTRDYGFINELFDFFIYLAWSEDTEYPTDGHWETHKFRVPNSANGSVVLSVSDFRWYPRYFILTPALYIDLGGFLGKTRLVVDIPVLGSGIAAGIMEAVFREKKLYLPSSYKYQTEQSYSSALSYDLQFTESYPYYPIEFHSLWGYSTGQAIQFKIESLGNAEDIVTVDLLGLPSGFTYSHLSYNYDFLHSKPYYIVRGTNEYDLNYDRGKIQTRIINIGVKAPDRITLPPGGVNITLIATSKGKTILGDPNPSVNITRTYTVPIQYGFEFYHEYSPGEVIQVLPEETVEIGFSGSNLANGNDIINVTGIFDKSNLAIEWGRDYAVGRYTFPNQTFTGKFSFTYTPDDIYRNPGNYTFDLVATSNSDQTKTNSTRFIIQFLPYYNVSTTITPEYTIMHGNYKLEFNFTVTNIGNSIDNFTIFAEGWTDYLNYSTRIDNLSEGASENVLINLTVPNPFIVPIQNHTFRITAKSDGNPQIYSDSFVTVNYLNPDATPPGLERRYDNATFVIPVSTLNLGPTWKPIDANPTTYTIWINDTVYDSDFWISGDSLGVIMKNIPGYANNTLFNVTVAFYDAMANFILDTVWVEVVPADDSGPIIDPFTIPIGSTSPIPDSYNIFFRGKIAALTNIDNIDLPSNFAHAVTLNWDCEEKFPLEMTLYLNGEPISEESFTLWCTYTANQYAWNTTYILNPGDLGEGTWNFTLEVKDMTGINVSSAIYVNIFGPDSTNPAISSAPPSSIVEGNQISFTSTDSYPHHWELYVDGELKHKEFWENGLTNAIQTENLSLILGGNSVELKVYDIANNYLSYPWTLTVTDITAPKIIVEPNDTTVFEHNNTNYLYWEVIDSNPGEFVIYLDGEEYDSGIWTKYNNTIHPGIEFLPMGTYEFEAIFSDMSGNEVISSFRLTVEDVIAPRIMYMESIIYEPRLSANWFEFHIIENHPQSYRLYRNDTLIDQGNMSEDYRVVFVDLEGLSIGAYSYRIELTDKSGNTGTGTIDVFIYDISEPIIDAESSLVIGEGESIPIEWIIQDTSTRNYALYRNGTLVDSKTFDSEANNITVTYNPMILSLGTYEFVLTVLDEVGFSYSFLTYVSIVDLAAPKIHKIGSYKVDFGDPNAQLVWIIDEIHPDKYQILVDGTTLEQGLWNGSSITLDLIGWAKGTYEVKLIVMDESGNIAVDIVEVIIAESSFKTQRLSTPFSPLILILFSFCISVVFARHYKKKKLF